MTDENKTKKLAAKLGEISGIITAAGIVFAFLGWVFQPHIDTYIKEQAEQAILAPLAKTMGVDEHGNEYTNDKVLPAVAWQFQEARTRDMLFSSVADSLEQYKVYLDFFKKATPEGLFWINKVPYWYTGKRDKYGEPEKFRTHMKPFPDNRIFYIDHLSREHFIWANPQR